jgi:hypothetical protein
VIHQDQTPHDDLEDTGVTFLADVLGEFDTAAVARAAASMWDIDALTRFLTSPRAPHPGPAGAGRGG